MFEVDYSPIDEMATQIDDIIYGIYDKLSLEIKDKIEQRKLSRLPKTDTIAEEDETWLKEHLDELFREGKGDKRPS